MGTDCEHDHDGSNLEMVLHRRATLDVVRKRRSLEDVVAGPVGLDQFLLLGSTKTDYFDSKR